MVSLSRKSIRDERFDFPSSERGLGWSYGFQWMWLACLPPGWDRWMGLWATKCTLTTPPLFPIIQDVMLPNIDGRSFAGLLRGEKVP